MELLEGIFSTFFFIVILVVIPMGVIVLAIGAIVKVLQAQGVISKPPKTDDK